MSEQINNVEAELLFRKANRRIELLKQLDDIDINKLSFWFSPAVLIVACFVVYPIIFWRDPGQACDFAFILFLCMGILLKHASQQTNKRIDALVKLLKDEDLLQTSVTIDKTSSKT